MPMEYCDLPGCPGAADDEPCSRCDPKPREAAAPQSHGQLQRDDGAAWPWMVLDFADLDAR